MRSSSVAPCTLWTIVSSLGPNGFVSPWHDIPLFADEPKKVYNMIVEIPRWSNAKMEMATAEPLSPIKQDVKNGQPRFVHNIFPHHGYIWNYGALPQTWENPEHKDQHTGANGDNDPIDVVEIGSKIQKRGAVVQVKVLGVLGLLDDGETDWKIVAIDIEDPLASQVNTIADVEKHFPGLLTATHEWFRIYKIPAGKKANAFAFSGQFKDHNFAYKIIEETNSFWKELIQQHNPPLNTECTVANAAHPIDASRSEQIVRSHKEHGEQEAPKEVEKWHYIHVNI